MAIKIRTILENSVLVEPSKYTDGYVFEKLDSELTEYMKKNNYRQLTDFDYTIHPAHNPFEREISVEVEVEKI